MVRADDQNEFEFEALFYGIEEVRDAYVKQAEEQSIVWNFVKKKPGFDLASYRKIIKIIRRSSPDILFLHSSAYILPAKFAALFSSRKMRILIRETQPNHLKTRSEWLGLRFSMIAANKIIFLSTEYRDAIKKKMPLLFRQRKTCVIPNGIDLEIFKPATTTSPAVTRIGMQSRLSISKDHATLIKAFNILLGKINVDTKLELWIAGDGDCRPALEQLSESLSIKDKVFFTGMLEEKALPAFINSLDIYVHATSGETMSNAIMQVMACRVPIIASDVLGVNNMVKNDVTGILVPLADAGKMAEAIESLLNDQEKRNTIAQNAYKFAIDNYSNKKMLASYKNIFLEGNK